MCSGSTHKSLTLAKLVYSYVQMTRHVKWQHTEVPGPSKDGLQLCPDDTACEVAAHRSSWP